MRPRPFGRGISDGIRALADGDPASMRPRPFGRGIRQHLVDAEGVRAASMRPRPFGRGIDDLASFFSDFSKLQ